MFASGLVKIRSGDVAWTQLTALNYHYFTQPLPHFLSWFAHHLPAWLDKCAVFMMLIIELLVPFALFFKKESTLCSFNNRCVYDDYSFNR